MTTDTRSTQSRLLRMTLFLLRAAMVVFVKFPLSVAASAVSGAGDSTREVDREQKRLDEQLTIIASSTDLFESNNQKST